MGIHTNCDIIKNVVELDFIRPIEVSTWEYFGKPNDYKDYKWKLYDESISTGLEGNLYSSEYQLVDNNGIHVFIIESDQGYFLFSENLEYVERFMTDFKITSKIIEMKAVSQTL